MVRRPGHRVQRAALLLLFYSALFAALSWLTTPRPKRTFLADRHRIRNRYVLMFLWTGADVPVFLESEGHGVFSDRQCGLCFLTNNERFMPASEYDAVLTTETPQVMHQTSEVHRLYRARPERFHRLNATSRCISAKFSSCDPRVAGGSPGETFGLCEFCEHIRRRRKLAPFIIKN